MKYFINMITYSEQLKLWNTLQNIWVSGFSCTSPIWQPGWAFIYKNQKQMKTGRITMNKFQFDLSDEIISSVLHSDVVHKKKHDLTKLNHKWQKQAATYCIDPPRQSVSILVPGRHFLFYYSRTILSLQAASFFLLINNWLLIILR